MLIALKQDSFNSVQEYTPGIASIQELEVVSAQVATACSQKILFSSIYWPDPDSDYEGQIEKFNIFLDYA